MNELSVKVKFWAGKWVGVFPVVARVPDELIPGGGKERKFRTDRERGEYYLHTLTGR